MSSAIKDKRLEDKLADSKAPWGGCWYLSSCWLVFLVCVTGWNQCINCPVGPYLALSVFKKPLDWDVRPRQPENKDPNHTRSPSPVTSPGCPPSHSLHNFGSCFLLHIRNLTNKKKMRLSPLALSSVVLESTHCAFSNILQSIVMNYLDKTILVARKWAKHILFIFSLCVVISLRWFLTWQH